MGNGKAYCKARYERLKAAHICVTCGKEEAFGNFVRCAECMEKHYLSVGNDIEKQRQNLKDLRARKKLLVNVICASNISAIKVRFIAKNII